MMIFLIGAMLQTAQLPPETWKERNQPDAPVIPVCDLGAGSAAIAKIAQLPVDVANELRRLFKPTGGILEADGPYNSSDVANRNTPARRFIRAYKTGDNWIVWYAPDVRRQFRRASSGRAAEQGR